jgi:hypothetical protein
MKKVELYDEVILKDGRKAAIVEIFPNSYVADIELGDGEYDTCFIYPEQIDFTESTVPPKQTKRQQVTSVA